VEAIKFPLLSNLLGIVMFTYLTHSYYPVAFLNQILAGFVRLSAKGGNY